MQHKAMKDTPNRAWLRGLPKCELHIHLEGTIEAPTLVSLSQRHDPNPLSLDQARQLYHYTDFNGFLEAFGQVITRLRTPADYGLVAREMARRLADDGVVHAEVFISLDVIMKRRGVAVLDGVMAELELARREAAEMGLSLFWLCDLVRDYGAPAAEAFLPELIRLRKRYPALVGVSIGGDEVPFPARDFAAVFKAAKQAGMHVTCHAGEAVGPSSVREALAVGAERIGHGITAVQDAALMEDLRRLQVPLEVAVTSNVKTQCCRRVTDHPVRTFFDRGLAVTLNSDDPAMFGATVLDEYEMLQREFGFTDAEMKQFAHNSIVASFLGSEKKQTLLTLCERYALPSR